jgi:hypothetical protein
MAGSEAPIRGFGILRVHPMSARAGLDPEEPDDGPVSTQRSQTTWR